MLANDWVIGIMKKKLKKNLKKQNKKRVFSGCHD